MKVLMWLSTDFSRIQYKVQEPLVPDVPLGKYCQLP